MCKLWKPDLPTLDKRLAILEDHASGGQHFNIVIRWVGQGNLAVGVTRLSDQQTVKRMDDETESAFQYRAAAVLGGEQWQVPEFAFQSGIAANLKTHRFEL